MRFRALIWCLLLVWAVPAGVYGQDEPEGDVPGEGAPPDGEAPEGEAPEGEAPDGEAPEGEAPAGEAPAGEAPDGAAPDGAAPGGDAAEPAYPEEALGVLPKPILDALPRFMTRFLRLKDYEALRAACPQPDAEGVATCLDTEAAQAVLVEQFGRAVVSTLVGYMDAELPNRLTEEDLDDISEPCEKQGEAWATCILDKPDADDDACEEPEGLLADCVVAHDRVSETFLAIQKERKTVFGPDVYVLYRGLLSVLTLEQLKALREACPQDEPQALLDCLDQNEAVASLVDVFQQVAAAIVKEAREELAQAGKALTDPEAEALEDRVLGLLLQFPARVLDNVSKTCSKLHPELETIDDPAKLEASLRCLEAEAETDAIGNPAYISKQKLHGWLGKGREKVVGAIREKEILSQSKAFERMLYILAGLAALGFAFILLRPLVIGSKYPDRKAFLWKASSFAALTFLLTVASLGATLLVMRTVQGAVMVDSTSPKLRLATAVFDVLEKEHQVQLLSDLSKERLDFIKTPLQAVVRATGDTAQQENFVAYVAEHWAELLQEPELKSLAQNAVMLKTHGQDLKSVLGFFRKVDWIMGYVPVFLALLAVLLYLLPMRETLVEIVNAPLKGAQGADASAMGAAMSTIKGEFKLIVPYLVVMLLVLPIVGVAMGLAVEPIVELLLGYLFQTVWYILGPGASAAVLDLSVGGVILLLVAALAIFIMAMGQLLGTVRKILRARFHWGQPLGRFARFFQRAPLASLAVLAFPVAYAAGVHYVAFEVIEPGVDFANLTTMDMLGLPIGGFLLFFLLFWALRGFKLMKFVGKYPVTRDA
ncbi:MAG: hypothetical protein H6706_20230 [Myxococcales bacterium]|nr:hypothetical protein [Myxococcales bacterium]